MTLYLDTSALVKLYVAEEGSPLVHQAVANAPYREDALAPLPAREVNEPVVAWSIHPSFQIL